MSWESCLKLYYGDGVCHQTKVTEEFRHVQFYILAYHRREDTRCYGGVRRVEHKCNRNSTLHPHLRGIPSEEYSSGYFLPRCPFSTMTVHGRKVNVLILALVLDDPYPSP